MEIACPQCSMQYALDPRLLPPGGVPVQCTRCSHVFIAAPPAQATTQTTQVFGAAPKRPSTQPNLNATLLFGDTTGSQPSASSTQAFGAVPPKVAPMAPVAPKPQAPAAGTPPSAMTTQAFGALPQVPPMAPVAKPAPAAAKPAAPAAAKPPPAAKPAPAAKPPAGAAAPVPTGTQVFGAVPQPQPQAKPPTPSTAQFLVLGTELPEPQPGPRPQQARPPSASTTPPFGSNPQMAPVARPAAGPAPAIGATQVFGAVPAQPPVAQAPEGTPPSASATQLFAGAPVSGAQAAGASGSQPGQPAVPASQPPGMQPRTPSRETPAVPAPRAPEPEPFVAVAATTPIELPEEILVQLNRPVEELMAESSSEDRASSAATGPSLSKPLELPVEELLEQAAENANNAGGRGKRPESGGKGRLLFIAAGVLVLTLTAFLTSPAWLSKANALPPEARAARDEALALLRRDDAASKEEALSRVRSLSAAHPQSAELLAEVGIALAMHLDDTQVRAGTAQQKVKRLQDQISRLTLARTPADWQSRVNAMREELTAVQQTLTPLEERAAVLSRETVQVLKQLATAPAEEEKEPALARLRARALMTAVLGGSDALSMAMALAQSGLPDWSSLTIAEYVLNVATAEQSYVNEAVSALKRMREADKTFLRTYVLGARIALMRNEPAVARELLDTVITLNPKHELAQQLHLHAEQLEKQAAEPKTTPEPEPETPPAPEPVPEPGTEAALAPGAETAPAPTTEATPAP